MERQLLLLPMPHHLIPAGSRQGHRGLRLPGSAIAPQLVQQRGNWIIAILGSTGHNVDKGLICWDGEEAVNALVGQHPALSEDAVDLVL